MSDLVVAQLIVTIRNERSLHKSQTWEFLCSNAQYNILNFDPFFAWFLYHLAQSPTVASFLRCADNCMATGGCLARDEGGYSGPTCPHHRRPPTQFTSFSILRVLRIPQTHTQPGTPVGYTHLRTQETCVRAHGTSRFIQAPHPP